MNQEWVDYTLKEHKLYIDSNGLEGRYADFELIDLRGFTLKGADLREADLVRANLEGVDLRGANLEGCWVSPGTKRLGNILIIEFITKYHKHCSIKSWIDLTQSVLGRVLYL